MTVITVVVVGSGACGSAAASDGDVGGWVVRRQWQLPAVGGDGVGCAGSAVAAAVMVMTVAVVGGDVAPGGAADCAVVAAVGGELFDRPPR